MATEARQRAIVRMQHCEADRALGHVGERALHRTSPHANRVHNWPILNKIHYMKNSTTFVWVSCKNQNCNNNVFEGESLPDFEGRQLVAVSTCARDPQKFQRAVRTWRPAERVDTSAAIRSPFHSCYEMPRTVSLSYLRVCKRLYRF